jgi:hypothetical protein
LQLCSDIERLGSDRIFDRIIAPHEALERFARAHRWCSGGERIAEAAQEKD